MSERQAGGESNSEDPKLLADSADSSVPRITSMFAIEVEVDNWLAEQSEQGADAKTLEGGT